MPADASPAQERLQALVGDWDAVVIVDGRPQLRSRTTFSAAPAGAFLIQHTDPAELDEEVAPEWVANSPFPIESVIGFDDFSGEFSMLYSDARGVSRVYRMTLADGEWRIWGQATADFFQRFSGRFSDDGATVAGRWERSADGQTWELDFELTYTRAG